MTLKEISIIARSRLDGLFDIEHLLPHGHTLFEFRILQFGGHLFQGVGDFDFLGAFLEAFAALDALGGVAGGSGNHAAHADGVQELAFLFIAEHVHLVVDLETAGDVDLRGAGHAVAAPGAGHFHEPFVRPAGLCHQLAFFRRQ